MKNFRSSSHRKVNEIFAEKKKKNFFGNFSESCACVRGNHVYTFRGISNFLGNKHSGRNSFPGINNTPYKWWLVLGTSDALGGFTVQGWKTKDKKVKECWLLLSHGRRSSRRRRLIFLRALLWSKF